MARLLPIPRLSLPRPPPLLSGYHLLHPSPTPGVALYPNPASIKIQFYSRHELPSDPAARFQDLFLTRPSWIAADLLPFINDLALNDKKKDSLLLKFTRASKTKVLDWELSDVEKRQWNKEKKVIGKDGRVRMLGGTLSCILLESSIENVISVFVVSIISECLNGRNRQVLLQRPVFSSCFELRTTPLLTSTTSL